MKPIHGLYRHYKGNEYQVLFTAKHSETLKDFVVYKTLYKNDLSEFWVRPVDMFCGEVEVDGKNVSRFTFIREL